MSGLVKGIVAGGIGGVIGAAVWAVIVLQFNYEIGWIAWGVGALVGVMVRAGAGDEVSPVTGAIAVVIAVAAVSAGKYAAVSVSMDKAMAEIAPQLSEMSDELALSCLADEVVTEYRQQGKALNWPGGQEPEYPEAEADYPKDVWADAKGRWDRGGPSWQAEYRDYQIQRRAHAVQTLVAEGKSEGFLASFTMFDFLFFGLAIMTAYGVGSGAGGD